MKGTGAVSRIEGNYFPTRTWPALFSSCRPVLIQYRIFLTTMSSVPLTETDKAMNLEFSVIGICHLKLNDDNISMSIIIHNDIRVGHQVGANTKNRASP